MIDKDEKTLLLNEIHHRVKNNFQIIISLIDLQANKHPDQRAIFSDLINRIKSMSLIYEELLLADNTKYIKFGEYVKELIANARFDYYDDIEFIIHEDSNILLSLDIATPVGIALNELFVNCCKHAFTNQSDKKVEVILREAQDNIEIYINDNGIGIDDKFLHEDSNTLGLNLVKMLIKEQIEGSFYINNNHGTKALIKFRK